MIPEKFKKTSFLLCLSVLVLLIFRLLLTATIPLLDKTEARYAEIARIMWETNQWIVPHIDYDIPFWAKPPLSTWLSAISFSIFGVTEFAARFPSFLLNVIIVIIVGKMIKNEGISFWLPGFILLTMPEFLIHTGVVSTDTALVFCTTMMMLSFWKTMVNEGKTLWRYIFFIALGLGFLAKGPLIVVLTFPPLFFWCLLDKNRFKSLFSKFPIAIGIIITTIIAVPWYYFAEQQSPGFLDYFFVGEHYKRFVDSGWKGDLYGRPKSQPIGMIWVFIFLFAFPWIQIVVFKLWQNRKIIFQNSWVSFLVFWLFWTPIFFTFSKNILHTYMLPVTVPIMFLIIHWWNDYKSKKKAVAFSLIFPVVAFVGYFGIFATGILDYYINSDKYLIRNQKIVTTNNQIPLYYWNEKNYSGQFYSNGKAKTLKNEKELDSVLSIHKKIFFVTENKNEILKKYNDKFTLVDSNYKTSVFISKPK
ncbi:ArnT family glycosyltransferase [Flavobacterium sp. ZT3R25]|uniref:ArnT family glycosyltransferase n=1 Tax=Flavobacterium galactosi TaxID=3398735 RepID=UPI003A86A17B